MNAMPVSSPRTSWSRVLAVAGGIALLLGAVDPMEGSLVILPGSAMVALGSYLDRGDRRSFPFLLWMFILIAIGVGALWGLSAFGGIGGNSRLSLWWGVLILPYLVGWSLTVWGPGSPRWSRWLGILVGLWYVTMAVMLNRNGHPRGDMAGAPSITLGAIGTLTIVGCISRLMRRTPPQP